MLKLSHCVFRCQDGDKSHASIIASCIYLLSEWDFEVTHGSLGYQAWSRRSSVPPANWQDHNKIMAENIIPMKSLSSLYNAMHGRRAEQGRFGMWVVLVAFSPLQSPMRQQCRGICEWTTQFLLGFQGQPLLSPAVMFFCCSCWHFC